MTPTSGNSLRLWMQNANSFLRRIKALLASALKFAVSKESNRPSRPPRRTLGVINKVAMCALESSDLHEILTGSLRQSLLATGMHAGVVYLAQEGDESLAMVCQQGLPDKLVEEISSLLLDDELLGGMLIRKQVLPITDLKSCAYRNAEKWANYGYRSFIAAPITSAENALGVIVLLHRKRRVFSRIDCEVLKSIASIVGAGIEKARQYEEIGNALLSMRRMSRLISETTPPVNLDEALAGLARAVCDATLALSSMITLMDREGRVLHRAAFGYTRQALLAASRAEAISARVLRTNQCVILSHPEKIADSLGPEILDAGFASAVCLPLRVGETPLGSLWLNYESPRRFPPWELEQLQRLADRVSAAIEHSRLHSSLRQKIERYQTTFRRCARISSSMQLKEVLQSLADTARELLSARIAAASFSRGGFTEQAISAAPHAREKGVQQTPAAEASIPKTIAAVLEDLQASELTEIRKRGYGGLPRESIRTGALLAAPLLDEGSEPAGLLIVSDRADNADFTEDDGRLLDALSKQAMVAIRHATRYARVQRSIKEYRGLLDDSAVAVATVNREQIITAVNRAFEELTGFSRQEIEGKMSLSDILPEAEREGESASWQEKAGDSSAQHQLEAQILTKDGTSKPVKLSVRAIEDSGSVALCLIELPQPRQAKSLHSEEREMSALLSIAPSLLAALQQSLDTAARHLEKVLARQCPQETHRTLDAASDEIQACRRSLEQIDVLVKPPPLAKKPVNINQMITQLVEEKAADLRRDDIGVVLRLDTDFPAVPADEQQLRWALGQLLDNSRLAMRQAGGLRTLTVETDRRGQTARTTIADTRPTLPYEKLQSLFHILQAHPESPEEAGLSLPACRAIIERHGWQISAECLSHEGITFVIEHPLPEDAPVRSHPQPAPGADKSRPQEESAHAAVSSALIIADEDVVIDLLGYYLRSEGHRVETSRDARLARRMLKERDYDLIFCDLKVPGLSSQQLFRWIQANKPRMTHRLIFITGGSSTLETFSFLEQPENRCLEKPFDLTELRRVIADALCERKE